MTWNSRETQFSWQSVLMKTILPYFIFLDDPVQPVYQRKSDYSCKFRKVINLCKMYYVTTLLKGFFWWLKSIPYQVRVYAYVWNICARSAMAHYWILKTLNTFHHNDQKLVVSILHLIMFQLSLWLDVTPSQKCHDDLTHHTSQSSGNSKSVFFSLLRKYESLRSTSLKSVTLYIV